MPLLVSDTEDVNRAELGEEVADPLPWDRCSMSSFLIEFLTQTQPTFMPSLPWAASIDTQVGQHTNRTKHIQGTLPQRNWAEIAVWPNLSPFHLLLSSLSFPERHCSHQHVLAFPGSLPFAACLPRRPASCLRLHLPAPLLLEPEIPAHPCTPAGGGPCPATPSTLNPPCRGEGLGGRD